MSIIYSKTDSASKPPFREARPFLKWAGGKRQLIPSILAALPAGLDSQKNLVYIEPFIGSGAFFFWFLKQYPHIKKAVINDINIDLVKAYTCIQKNPKKLIERLQKLQNAYAALATELERKQFFIQKREQFNNRRGQDVQQTSLLIFLNKTCYNGLYRVNSQNQYNVPFGKYLKPKICDTTNILNIHGLLQKTLILHGDYSQTLAYARGQAFFYMDPPYKPISKTSSFNAYAKEAFDDRQQIRLKHFCDTLSDKKIPWLLSNSDPKNQDPSNRFFEDLYGGPGIFIHRVMAKRSINSNPSKRGEIRELLISNYPKQGIEPVIF